jgi:hypothetical protein
VARIFLSSTMGDLIEHRAAVIRALQEHNHEVLAFELNDFPRARTLIEQCELYVGLVGFRYGFVPQEANNPQGDSIVMLEYRRAKELGKPTLMFLQLDRSALDAASGSFEESLEFRRRTEHFRDEVRTEQVAEFFSSPEDLTARVVRAVTVWETQARVATLRGDVHALPPDLDTLTLAFLLVLDHQAEPTLLLHPDAEALTAAVVKWASNNPTETSGDPFAALRAAFAALRSKYPTQAPNPLWVAWMRATRAHLLNPTAGEAAPKAHPGTEDHAR